MVWNDADQSDWWISGDPDALTRELPALAELSDLRTTLWSNDPSGQRLLTEHRSNS